MGRRELSRRGFLGGVAAAGAVGVAGGRPGHADARVRAAGADLALPGRGELTIRGAYVLSMDDRVGDLPRGDVHVRDGRIVAVGHRLRRRGEVLDGRGHVLMPGIVDTHWHLWTTLFRSLASSSPENAYFPLNVRLGSQASPRDLHRGTRLALADALSSGITTVHDWAHNLRSPEHADESLRAHTEAGLRGRFSYGTAQGQPVDQPLDLEDVARVQREWFASGRAELLRLGLAGRPPGQSPPEVYRTEWAAARRLGLPVSYHAQSTRAQGGLGTIATLAAEGILGPDVQLIHALFTTPEERALIARSGASVSVSPWSELLIGYGVTPIRDLVASGVLLTLSVDTLSLTGTADPFSIVRLTAGLARGQAEQEFALSTRRVLQMATIDGARALGLGDVVGSITPGKRADLVLVRTDDVNIAPFTDAANVIGLAAQPQNVDTVVVDGRVLKREGRLVALDADRVVRDASASLAALLRRAEEAGGSPAGAAAAAVPAGGGGVLAGCCG